MMGRELNDVRIDGIMPELTERWPLIDWGKCLSSVRYPIDTYKQTSYKKRGKYAIVDQGQELISGYTDEAELLYSDKLPVIIFGDHTRAIKYIDFQFALGADGCKILRPVKDISPRFFFYYLAALKLAAAGYSRHYKYLKTIRVPLPHQNEQNHIVEKLDVIMPKVKSAKARLEKIPVILKKFRQSVLAAACSGRLTEDWREGKDLPEWEEVSLKNICLNIDYVNKKNVKENQNFYYIDIGAIDNKLNKIISYKTYKWKDAPSRAQQIIFINDILFSTVRTYLKNIAIVDDTKFNNQICSSGFTVIRANEKYCFFKYLFYYIITDYFVNPLNDLQIGSSYPAVKDSDVLIQSIPLPPLEEQHEIVRRVEKLFSLADSLETKYKKATERVEKIEQSVLAKAFRGELVDPDPNDEPADELLKRILEEKAKLEGGKKARKKSKGVQNNIAA